MSGANVENHDRQESGWKVGFVDNSEGESASDSPSKNRFLQVILIGGAIALVIGAGAAFIP